MGWKPERVEDSELVAPLDREADEAVGGFSPNTFGSESPQMSLLLRTARGFNKVLSPGLSRSKFFLKSRLGTFIIKK